MAPRPESTVPPIRIVELVGLPGTGKSTIARCLESILGGAGIQIRSRSVMLADQGHFMHRQQRRLRLIVRNANRCGRLYRHSLRLIAESEQRSSRDLAIVIANFWSIIALMTERHAGDDRVVIADQGLVQAMWSVQLSSSRELSLDAWTPLLLAAGFESTLLAHVQTDIPVSQHRVSTRARNRTRLDSGGAEERSRRWQTALENMNYLVEWARKTMPCDHCGGRVLSVMNQEGAPEAAAAEIAAAYFKRNALTECA